MITCRMFSRLFDMISDEIGISASKLELVGIRTEFNHGTGARLFQVFVQLPDGSTVCRVIEEVAE